MFAIRGDHLLRQLHIALQQSLGRVRKCVACAAAHIADHSGECFQVGIKGCNDVLCHDDWFPAPRGRATTQQPRK